MTRRRTCRLTCPPDLPYDPAPELAALLRVLSWAQPIGPAWPGSSADLAGRLRRGLGLPADATTAEYEAALAPPRTGAATWTGSGATQPGHETARAGPPPPGAGSPARRHRGPAQCAGERRGAHAMIHDAEALARLLSLATGGLLAPGACEEACDWPGGDNGDALKGDRTVRVRPRP